MAKELLLRLIDSNYKECEVTGRDMGGDTTYEVPVSLLSTGYVSWPKSDEIPNHSVTVDEIGEDYVKVSVGSVSGRRKESYTLHVGESDGESYMFGEWSYSYKIMLVETDEATVASFQPDNAYRAAVAAEQAGAPFATVDKLYKAAARMGSAEAYAWLVRDALRRVKAPDTGYVIHGVDIGKALDWVKQAEQRGIGGPAHEALDARETFYIEDGVLYGVFRGAKVLTLPPEVTQISYYCFSRCRYTINKLIIPPTVQVIDDMAFMDCNHVREVEIQGSTLVGQYAFSRCKSLKRLAVAPGVVFNGRIMSPDMNVTIEKLP